MEAGIALVGVKATALLMATKGSRFHFHGQKVLGWKL